MPKKNKKNIKVKEGNPKGIVTMGDILSSSKSKGKVKNRAVKSNKK